MPQNADPMEDQFAKKNASKAEKVAKNEIQRMRNIVKAKKGALPRTGYLGPDTASSTDVSQTAFEMWIFLIRNDFLFH